MSFENKIIQYGTRTLPVLEITPNYFDRYNITFMLNGVSYSTQSLIINSSGNPMTLFTSNIKYRNISDNEIFCALKGKNGNFLMWAFVGGNKSTMGCYINTTMSLSGAVRITSTTVNTTLEASLAIFSTPYGITTSFRYDGYSDSFSVGVSNDFIEKLLIEIESLTLSPIFGNASSSGGYSGGSFDNSSDTIAVPNKPSIGVTNVGFVNVYNPSVSGLINLGSELFPDFTPPQPAPLTAYITEALQLGFNNVVENITNFTNMFINSKLIDYVIDCHVIPIKPTVTTSENIKIGFKSFNQTASKVTSDYIDFDCGSLNIKEYYTNFIDYVGTRAKLYLPFVGFVPIENEYFQNGILNVKYRFNVIDGSFMCYVLATSSKSELANSVIASYGGNACVHIPITGLNYSNMITGLASGTVATIATASIGGGLASKALSPALASAGVAVGTLNSALNTLATKPSMQSSNGYNSTSAYLGVRYPYLIIEREVSNFSEYYTSENGLPCNITKTINELSGYIEMDNIHMETLTCTDEEKTMIENLLKSGIIV